MKFSVVAVSALMGFATAAPVMRRTEVSTTKLVTVVQGLYDHVKTVSTTINSTLSIVDLDTVVSDIEGDLTEITNAVSSVLSATTGLTDLTDAIVNDVLSNLNTTVSDVVSDVEGTATDIVVDLVALISNTLTNVENLIHLDEILSTVESLLSIVGTLVTDVESVVGETVDTVEDVVASLGIKLDFTVAGKEISI